MLTNSSTISSAHTGPIIGHTSSNHSSSSGGGLYAAAFASFVESPPTRDYTVFSSFSDYGLFICCLSSLLCRARRHRAREQLLCDGFGVVLRVVEEQRRACRAQRRRRRRQQQQQQQQPDNGPTLAAAFHIGPSDDKPLAMIPVTNRGARATLDTRYSGVGADETVVPVLDVASSPRNGMRRNTMADEIGDDVKSDEAALAQIFAVVHDGQWMKLHFGGASLVNSFAAPASFAMSQPASPVSPRHPMMPVFTAGQTFLMNATPDALSVDPVDALALLWAARLEDKVGTAINWLSVVSNCLTYFLRPSQVLYTFLFNSADFFLYVMASLNKQRRTAVLRRAFGRLRTEQRGRERVQLHYHHRRDNDDGSGINREEYPSESDGDGRERDIYASASEDVSLSLPTTLSFAGSGSGVLPDKLGEWRLQRWHRSLQHRIRALCRRLGCVLDTFMDLIVCVVFDAVSFLADIVGFCVPSRTNDGSYHNSTGGGGGGGKGTNGTATATATASTVAVRSERQRQGLRPRQPHAFAWQEIESSTGVVTGTPGSNTSGSSGTEHDDDSGEGTLLLSGAAASSPSSSVATSPHTEPRVQPTLELPCATMSPGAPADRVTVLRCVDFTDTPRQQVVASPPPPSSIETLLQGPAALLVLNAVLMLVLVVCHVNHLFFGAGAVAGYGASWAILFLLGQDLARLSRRMWAAVQLSWRGRRGKQPQPQPHYRNDCSGCGCGTCFCDTSSSSHSSYCPPLRCLQWPLLSIPRRARRPSPPTAPVANNTTSSNIGGGAAAEERGSHGSLPSQSTTSTATATSSAGGSIGRADTLLYMGEHLCACGCSIFYLSMLPDEGEALWSTHVELMRWYVATIALGLRELLLCCAAV